MTRVAAIAVLSLLLVLGGAATYAAGFVTELHPYSEVVTLEAQGRTQLMTVSGTITDQDTIPDPVTVTVTSTVAGTTTAPLALPVARFTYTPAAPWVGATVTFDGSTSSCTDQPCTYQWVDDGPNGPGDPQWSLCASGVTCVFRFTSPGTIWARLNLTDKSGDKSTVMQQFTLLSSPPATTTTTTTPTTTVAGASRANVWVAP